MSMRQVHGNFHPSSATRRVRRMGQQGAGPRGLVSGAPCGLRLGDLRASAGRRGEVVKECEKLAVPVSSGE